MTQIPPQPSAPRAFQVLFVCAGNTCRSPMAEQLLRARLGSTPGFAVRSAGVQAEVGAPITPEAAQVVSERAGEAYPHRARQLTSQLMSDSDLVLVATRDLRAEAVRLAPAVVRRTFTLKEFARLASLARWDEAVPLAEVAASVAVHRSDPSYDPGKPADDDIVDPIGQGADVYSRTGAEIDAAVSLVADLLLDSIQPA